MDVSAAMQQFGSVGVIAYLLWHIVSKAIPDLVKQFREECQINRTEMAKFRDQFMEQMDKRDAVMESLAESVRELAERVDGCGHRPQPVQPFQSRQAARQPQQSNAMAEAQS